MDSAKIQKYISYVVKILFAVLALLIFLSVVELETNKKSPEEIARILEQQKTELKAIFSGATPHINKNLPEVWPPKMNTKYPDIELLDQAGKEVKISDFKGKVILLEFIDITSPISQAQSGAGLIGAYPAMVNQDVDKHSMPISDLLRRETMGSLMLPHDDIMQVKVIIYGRDGGAGSRDDAMNWADHFDFKTSDNVIVAVPKKDMRGDETSSVLTGFQLIDKNMILRVDSAGVMPKHNLKMTLVPLVSKLLL